MDPHKRDKQHRRPHHAHGRDNKRKNLLFLVDFSFYILIKSSSLSLKNSSIRGHILLLS